MIASRVGSYWRPHVGHSTSIVLVVNLIRSNRDRHSRYEPIGYQNSLSTSQPIRADTAVSDAASRSHSALDRADRC